MARLGLSYTTAFHRCESCICKTECRAWIDKAPASALLAPRFCPNSDIFFELKFDALSCNRALSVTPETDDETRHRFAGSGG